MSDEMDNYGDRVRREINQAEAGPDPTDMVGAINNSARQARRGAIATEMLAGWQGRRLKFLQRGMKAALVGLAVVIVMLGGLTGWAVWKITLIARQNFCYTQVQGEYIRSIGDLADSNGASLRGETVDPTRNRARVVELRRASTYVRDENIARICYTSQPDTTPTDGDIDNDGRVDIEPDPSIAPPPSVPPTTR